MTFNYRPFGIDPSNPIPLSREQQAWLYEHTKHMRTSIGLPESGPPDPVADIHRDGKWLEPGGVRVSGIAWRPLRPGEKALDLNLYRIAYAA